ncbi:MAG: asparagine synthase (glutamine-hydrolyzing) [Betaproteobacteria bacterium]|nr:asparagine synthase (glutamine-hydrolyzing) [Betaproteobacteria bacterium]
MCGIAGFTLKQAEPAARAQIERMTRAMSHRGPDGEGYFLSDGVALGHRRLSIIDVAGGDQPIYNEDASVVVVYNGEIFNYKDVRSTLIAKGHQFKTQSDTEVIVHAYEEYGDDCPSHFRGMFAFALYDLQRRRLLLGRDRLGIKPLYFHVSGDQLMFASEINPLLQQLASRPGVREDLIDFQMSLGYVPGDNTLFQGIRRLLPGHTMSFEAGKVSTRQFWDIAHIPPLSISEESASERFDSLLTESVRLRLMSEVPLGAFLSGGVDSSAIVALMSKLTGRPVKTFSVGYVDDPESSELEYARIVAKHFGADHHEFILESGDFFDSLDLLLTHMEEPVVESAAVALYQLSRLAREHVTVILSGEGGDEILAGYPLYRSMPRIDRIHALVGWMPGPLQAAIGTRMPTEKLAKYWDWACTPLARRYWGISNDVTSSIKHHMYSPDFLAAHGNRVGAHFHALFMSLEKGSNLRRMSYVDLKSWLPDDLLIKADKMTMACSLELRVPMLDHHLLEFCTALPDSLRRHGGTGKVLLKRAMRKYLPAQIIDRPKKGFPVPIANWFRGSLYPRVCEILLDPRTRARKYFQGGYVEHVLERHKSGAEDLSRRIFSLLALELWHRKYMDQQ